MNKSAGPKKRRKKKASPPQLQKCTVMAHMKPSRRKNCKLKGFLPARITLAWRLAPRRGPVSSLITSTVRFPLPWGGIQSPMSAWDLYRRFTYSVWASRIPIANVNHRVLESGDKKRKEKKGRLTLISSELALATRVPFSTRPTRLDQFWITLPGPRWPEWTLPSTSGTARS